MTDGHTKKGSWIVDVELSKDEVQQIIRSLEMGRSLGLDEPGIPQTMDMVAYNLFRQQIIEKLYKAILEQEAKDAKV